MSGRAEAGGQMARNKKLDTNKLGMKKWDAKKEEEKTKYGDFGGKIGHTRQDTCVKEIHVRDIWQGNKTGVKQDDRGISATAQMRLLKTAVRQTQ